MVPLVRIAIITARVPNVRGGAEVLAAGLRESLRAAGHAVEIVELPFAWHPHRRLLESIELACSYRLDAFDRVIALKFPAYLVEHPQKIVWLLHQHRPANDLWGGPWGAMPIGVAGERVRDAVRAADRGAFDGAHAIFAISGVVAARLIRFNEVEAEVLEPPLVHPERFWSGQARDYVLMAGRVAPLKRQRLAIDAMAYVRSPVRLVVAGAPATRAEGYRVRLYARRRRSGRRVELRLNWVPDAELARLYAEALAVLVVPFDEDYGYVALEAAASGRPVVTTSDSGGVAATVRDGETGLITEPDPRELAAALDRLAEDPDGARRMGEAARADLDRRALSWEHVVERLTS